MIESRLRREALGTADFICVDYDPWGNRYLPDSPDAGEWGVWRNRFCALCGRRVVIVAPVSELVLPSRCNRCVAIGGS